MAWIVRGIRIRIRLWNCKGEKRDLERKEGKKCECDNTDRSILQIYCLKLPASPISLTLSCQHISHLTYIFIQQIPCLQHSSYQTFSVWSTWIPMLLFLWYLAPIRWKLLFSFFLFWPHIILCMVTSFLTFLHPLVLCPSQPWLIVPRPQIVIFLLVV